MNKGKNQMYKLFLPDNSVLEVRYGSLSSFWKFIPLLYEWRQHFWNNNLQDVFTQTLSKRFQEMAQASSRTNSSEEP